MPVDPQIEAMFAGQPEWPPIRSLPVEVLRQSVIAASTAMPAPAITLSSITDSTIPGPAGDVPVRIYTPEGSGPFPVTVYFHGGGFVVGNLDTQDMIARAFAAGAESIVISVDYRLAPENAFPAAPEDCWAAVRWAAANADSIEGDPTRLAVAGDSAGGVLANAMAILALEAGGPKISAVVNWYGPAIHPLPETGSMVEFEQGPVLRADDVRYFHELYISDPAQDDDYRASPAKAPSHVGLPPHFIGTAEIDPARDSAELYAPVLTDAGVEVEMRRYPGMIHGFVSWVAFLPGAQQAMADACAFARRHLAKA